MMQEAQAQNLYLQAREHWRNGEMEQAETAYRQSIEMDATLPHPHYDLATMLSEKGDSPRALQHFQRFVELAANIPELAPQVEQVRQRLEESQVSFDATVLTTEIQVSKVDATHIAQKRLEGKVRKKEHIAEGAPKAHIPLWRLHCTMRKGLFGMRKVNGYLYFNGTTGKLLTVQKDTLCFTDISEIKAHKVTGLDGTAQFTHRLLEELITEPMVPKVGKEVIGEKAHAVLKVEVLDTELVLFPVWKFTVIHKDTGKTRQMLIDTTFGRELTQTRPIPKKKQPGIIQRVGTVLLLLAFIIVLIAVINQWLISDSGQGLIDLINQLLGS